MRAYAKKLLLAAVLLFLCCLPFFATAEVAHARFRSVQDIDWAIGFSDDYLNYDGQIYHQDLAQSSIGMALSAFRIPDVELARKGDNIQSYLKELGFTGISLDQYNIEPSIQTIASAIGMKNMTDNLGPFTAIAVAISGGGYQDEWKSNFLIGNGLHHEGFNRAAGQVYNHLVGYIAQHGTLGRIKVWITGYSRAAATANRTAAMMLDNKLVIPDNLFAYTFATPNVTRQQNAASYPSIFNIVGAFDPVPMIPFDEWGFTRFGTTYFLPTPEADSDYADKVKPVKAIYREMTGVDYWTNQSGNRLVQKLFGMMSDMVSGIDDYTQHYQSLLIDLWSNKSNPLGLLTSLVQTVTSDSTLWQQLSSQADKALSIVSNAAGGALLQEIGTFKNEWSGSAGLSENLMHEHFPKGYLAWLCAYAKLDAMVGHNLTYRQLSIGGDVSISVYNADGTLACVFSVTDGAVSGQSGNSELTVAPSGDAMTVSIPADEAYRVEIVAQSTDPVDFLIREGTIGKIAMNSYQAPTQATTIGATYSCELPTVFYTDGTRYTLQWQGGSVECVPVTDATTDDKLELNSSATQLLSENLTSIIVVILLLLLQIIFLLTVALRALRRHHHKAHLRKTQPQPTVKTKCHRLRFRRGQHRRNGIKIMAILLLVCAVLILAEGILAAVMWYTEYHTIGQTTLVWYITLMTLPLVFLLLYAAFPALYAALFALFWSEEDVYALKTGRYFAIFALPYTGILLYYLSSSVYAGFQQWSLICSVAQVALLLLLIALAYRTVHAEHKLLKLEAEEQLKATEQHHEVEQAVGVEQVEVPLQVEKSHEPTPSETQKPDGQSAIPAPTKPEQRDGEV